MSTLGEFDRIHRLLRPLTGGDTSALSLADDAALIDAKPGHQIVATTDTMVETIHFLAGEPPARLAAKLLRVNLSDLAAMGADPFSYLLTTLLPRDLDDVWLADFARGLADDQNRYGVRLIGGDSVSTPGPLSVGITAFGSTERGRSLLRSGAQPGDGLYVTGTPGDAVLGLHLLQHAPIAGVSEADRKYLTGRYHLPEPRVSVGQRLVGIASAALDLSDGLAGDLQHICTASGVSASVDVDLLPWSPAARRLLDLRPDLTSLAIAGGDDYELLFTAPRDREAELARIGTDRSVPITRIGDVGKGASARFLDGAGRALSDLTGWRHF